MAKIPTLKGVVDKTLKTTKSVWKRGIGAGALIGTSVGVAEAVGIHPFIANIGGAVLTNFAVKDPVLQQIAFFESAREGMKKLMSAD